MELVDGTTTVVIRVNNSGLYTLSIKRPVKAVEPAETVDVTPYIIAISVISVFSVLLIIALVVVIINLRRAFK